MPLDNPKAGLGFAAEFQSSALPWVTSSIATVTPYLFQFDRVARFVTFMNHGTPGLRVGFSKNGVNGSNYFLVSGSSPVSMELRVKELWVRSDSGTTNYSALAGLTNVFSTQMTSLSGSLENGSPGWNGVG